MKQRGMTLVLLAISMFALFAFLGIAVDLTLYMSYKTRAQTSAEHAVLSVLNQQLRALTSDTKGGDTLDNRLIEGIRQARGILKDNPQLSMPLPNELKRFTAEVDRATLTPGRVVTSAAQLAASINSEFECDAEVFTKPVFCAAPHDSSGNFKDAETVGINAMRLTGYLYPSVSTRFLAAVGFKKSLGVQVSAVAAVTPVEAMFLVDVSPTSGGQRHLRVNTTADEGGGQITIKKSEFVFQLNRAASATDHDITWAALDAIRSGQYRNNRHFQSEYVGRNIVAPAQDWTLHPDPSADPARLSESRYLGSSLTTKVREINAQDLGASAGYRGPQPLLRVLQSIYTMIRSLQVINGGGNKFGLIFFDGSMSSSIDKSTNGKAFGWNRVFKLTDQLDQLEFRFVEDNNFGNRDGPTGWHSLSNANTIRQKGMSNPILDKLLPHGVFSTYNAFTNVQAALYRASDEFAVSEASGAEAQRVVIYAGDGMLNCNQTDGTNKGMASEVTCVESPTDFFRATDETRALAKLLGDRNIPVNAFLFGANAAHSLDIKADAANHCMTQDEAIDKRIPYATGTMGCEAWEGSTKSPFGRDNRGCAWAYFGSNGRGPFREAGKRWYEIAAVSGGRAYPIYPEPGGFCTPRTTCTCELGVCNGGSNPGFAVRTSDPECRSQDDQVQAAVQQIFGRTVQFKIVDVS